MVAELQSGPYIVMEVSRKDEGPNIVTDFRNLCGPMDPVSMALIVSLDMALLTHLSDIAGYCSTNQTRHAPSQIRKDESTKRYTLFRFTGRRRIGGN
jgi:hypothetical protein